MGSKKKVEVEYIFDFRLNGRKQEFKVKWKGETESDAEWKQLEKFPRDEEMVRSFKEDFLAQFLSFCGNSDYRSVLSKDLSTTAVFARIGLLSVPASFKFDSPYRLKKMEQRAKLAEAAAELNRKLSPNERIHVENEVDLELLPDDVEWNPGHPTDINLEKEVCLKGCDCSGTCFYTEDCCFPNRYTRKGRLQDLKDTSFVYECGNHCGCDPKICLNRVVRNGGKCSLCIFKTPKKGWGVKTLKDIERGTLVSEYSGEIITKQEFDRRSLAEDYTSKGMTYFFQIDHQLTIDGTKVGNEARFFNHSCHPNMGVFHVMVDINVTYHRLAFFANSRIEAGDELTFEYQLKGQNYAGKTCECGWAGCKKVTI